MECLVEDGLSVSNLVGLGSDGASAMVGHHKSVATLMQQAQLGIVLFRCTCHSLHLAASKALVIMPTAVEFLIRESHKWFSTSPKRSLAYKELYQVMEGKMPKEIPGHSETRWLAYLEAIVTILDQCDDLKLHFQLAASTEHCYTAQQLCDMFSDVCNKLYLLCMRKVLTEVNKVFQAANADVTKLTGDLLQLYACLMQLVVILSILEKVPANSLDSFAFRENLMPVSCVHFGFEFENACGTASLSIDQLLSIRERCRNFVVELADQVQMRLPSNIETAIAGKAQAVSCDVSADSVASTTHWPFSTFN